MKVDVNVLSATKRELIVEIPAEKVSEEMEKLMSELRTDARIPGFRPGKVPDAIIKMRIGKDLRKQVGANLIEQTFEEALKEIKQDVLGSPELGEIEVLENAPFVYKAMLQVVPEFEVSQYKGLEITMQDIEVSESEISEGLTRIQKGQSTFEVITNRTAQMNDRIFGKLTLTENDTRVPGWVNRSVDFTIGSGRMFPGSDFESKVIGASAGQHHEFELEFASDYSYYVDFAGKKIHVNIDVSELKEMKTPALDDDLAKDMGLENLDQLKQNVIDTIKQNKQSQQKEEIRSQLMSILVEKNQFEVPPVLVRYHMESMASRIRGIDKLPSEEIEKMMMKPAEELARRDLILEKIAKIENLEVTQEELDDVFEEELSRSREDREKMKHEWEEHGIFEHLKKSMLRDKAFEVINSNAKITIAPASQKQDSGEQPSTEEKS